MSASLIGKRIRRIDMPSAALLALSIGGGKSTEVLIYRFSGSPRGAGLVTERPRGAPADPFTRRMRKLIAGARVETMAEGPEHRLVIGLRRGDGRWSVVLDADAKRGRLWVLDHDGRLIGARDGRTDGLSMSERVPEEMIHAEDPVDEIALRSRGPSLVDAAADSSVDAQRRALLKALRRARKRLGRRLGKIDADAARARQAPELRARASLVLSHVSAYEDGASSLEVMDFTRDPPVPLEVPIDPRIGAKGEAEALFHRARRVERGAKKAVERRRVTEDELKRLEAIEERVADAPDAAALEALAHEAARAGVRGAREGARERSKGAAPRRPFRRFVGHGGRPILVGRSAADNDSLTLRHAKPSDLWLHARGRRGSHVVVPLDRGEECPDPLLIDAATLAVHFSAAAGEDRVEVQHTPRRYVRKPRGAAPGAVLVDRERVLVLRLEPERLRALLEAEEA